MGIFGNFFMSESEKAKLEQMNKKRVVRGVERLLENLENRSIILNKESSVLWDKARKELLSGQKTEASNTLRIYKAKQVMARRNDHSLMVMRSRYDAIVGASDMQEVMGALNELAGSTNLDVDQMEENMDGVDAAVSDTRDVTKAIDAAFQRDMTRLDLELSSAENGEEDDLMKLLEQEVSAGAATGAGVTSGQERLRNMLNGKK